jgi:hypothetical protein
MPQVGHDLVASGTNRRERESDRLGEIAVCGAIGAESAKLMTGRSSDTARYCRAARRGPIERTSARLRCLEGIQKI